MSAMIGNPLLLAPEGYQISRSVRLRSSASAYLQRTNGTTGTDPLKFTVSGWMKRGLSSASYFPLLGSDTGSNAFDFIGFQGDNLVFRIRNSSSVDLVQVQSSAVYRDFSAWYHIVAVYDAANATSTERVKLYVNGVQVTAFSTATYPAQNTALTGTFLTNMQIGRTNTNNVNQNYGDGYLTEVNFIDGQSLTPAAFGETNPITGVWKPKKYTGTYGTNGFYLNFSDNSAATAAAIGKDYSGNGNNWTPNNISLTAGATYDSMLDVPTLWADGGNGRGNYCTLSPIFPSSGTTLSNGNLDRSATTGFSSIGTVGVSSGKWYWEATAGSSNGANNLIGIGAVSAGTTPQQWYGTANGWAYFGSTGNKFNNGTGTAYGATFTAGDVIGVALDCDNGTLTFYKNGTSQGTAFTGLNTGAVYAPTFDSNLGAATVTVTANFGQRPFAYTPPTGFKALNTLNLPTPTIPNGRKFFDATTYTGTGNSLAVANGGFQPDLVWMKSRSNATSNALVDSSRGVTKVLYSQATDAETTWSDALTSFDANGFTIAANSTFNTINVSPRTYVGWQWKEGATNGFDIAAITAQSSGSATFAHSLGVAPAMYIVKPRANVGGWNVYHKDLGANKVLALNGTGAAATSTTTWNNTAPTSSVFSLGTDYAGFGTQIVYLFAEVAGFSKFGSYTGNGSADGPFVFCGFRPRWVMIKRTDSTSDWQIMDTSRDVNNAAVLALFPNLSNAETSGYNKDLLSNGFKLRDSGASTNASGGTYIYAAFAENPFKYSLAR